MWSDSRLVSKQGVLCLCTKCTKEDEPTGIECPIHKRFMEGTRFLQVAAPVIACLDFVDDRTKPNLLDEYLVNYGNAQKAAEGDYQAARDRRIMDKLNGVEV